MKLFEAVRIGRWMAIFALLFGISEWRIVLAQDRGHVQLVSVTKLDRSIGFSAGVNPMYESKWHYQGPVIDLQNLSSQLQTLVTFECSAFQKSSGATGIQDLCDLQADLNLENGAGQASHWQVVSSVGKTDIQHGQQKTALAIWAPIPTSVEITLRLSMIVTDPDLFPSGNYASVVTASITSY